MNVNLYNGRGTYLQPVFSCFVFLAFLWELGTGQTFWITNCKQQVSQTLCSAHFTQHEHGSWTIITLKTPPQKGEHLIYFLKSQPPIFCFENNKLIGLPYLFVRFFLFVFWRVELIPFLVSATTVAPPVFFFQFFPSWEATEPDDIATPLDELCATMVTRFHPGLWSRGLRAKWRVGGMTLDLQSDT